MTKLDIGCGANKREGFTGMDQYAIEGVDIVHDVRVTPWPIESDSVTEAHCSHFLEHLTSRERVALFNELQRVMKTGAKCTIITPHWCSCRAYGDPTHVDHPVSEMTYMYVLREWRLANAPHTDKSLWPDGYDCDFDASWGYHMNGQLAVRNEEYRQFALANYKEAALDIIATITKR